MVTSAAALKLFGDPGGSAEGRYMIRWEVPDHIQKAFAHVRFSAMGTVGFPKVIYCNRMMMNWLSQALQNLIARGFAGEMQTWDGCYIIRNKRGGNSWSLHAWGLAVDVNAATNRLGARPTLSAGFVQCWKDAGFDWGGDWKTRPDGMHFQLARVF